MGGGALITLEGGEGSGKTTQSELLLAWLRDRGVRVAAIREPGGTLAGERLRSVLLDTSLEALEPPAEVLLFAASRAQAVAQVIRPALAEGRVVVCDRFVDSSLAYQGYGLGVDQEFILAVNAAVTTGIRPDRTFLFDVPVAEGMRRKKDHAASDRIESRPTAYHEAVRAGYLRLAAADARRFRVLDARRAADIVQAEVRLDVAAVLSAKGVRV